MGLDIKDLKGQKLHIRRSINNYGEQTDGKNENAIRSFTLCDLAYKIIKEEIGDREDGLLFDIPTQDAYRKCWKNTVNIIRFHT